MRVVSSALAAAALLAACSAPSDTSQAEAITAVMMATWDRPEAPLDAGPVAASGAYAVADWTQGDAGGRALLRRIDGAWVVVLCSGDLLRSAEGLGEAGVPADEARRIADRLAAAEADVAPERLAAMASFTGIVRMDGEG